MQVFTSSRNKYEPIEPAPRRGQRKFLNSILIGLCVGGLATVTLVVVMSITNPPSQIPDADVITPVDENNIINNTVVDELNNNSTILEHRLNLKAEAPGAPEENASTTDGVVRDDPLVTLDAGELRGTYLKSRAGRDYLAFLGVPYAKPPLGDLRFQLPVEGEPWNGTLNATQTKPDCIQKDKYNPQLVTKGSEDCLYLNIYTPKNYSDLGKRRNRFPVMFYIHGGGQFGSGTRYHADYFMDENVVLITVHYRLGVLGNLNVNDTEARGNQGMKDQVMALQWVKDNIKKFGGDNKKVTIFGNSYGAMEVAAHLVSPMSKDLFQRAISQSGTSIKPEMISTEPIHVAHELARKLNCTSSNNDTATSNVTNTSVESDDIEISTKDMLACFKKIDAVTIILQSFLMDFKFSIESPSDDENVFLPDVPLNILQNGDINAVPSLYGTVSGEGLFAALPILAFENVSRYFDEHWENATIDALMLESASDPVKIVNSAREFYLGSQNLSRELQPNLTDMFSDRLFVHAASVFASYQLAANSRREKVFLYYFNKDADKTYAQPALEVYGNNETDFLGAGHADELQFLFPYYDYPYIPEGSKNANFSKMMVRLWTTFADTGKPNGGDNIEEWLPIEDPKPYRWYLIEDEPKMVDFVGPRMEFWDQFNLTDLYGLPH